jgi:hypothetical protein
MKPSTIAIALISLFLGVFAGAAGSLVITHDRALGSTVCYVEVLNDTATPLESVGIEYEDGAVLHGVLGTGERVVLPLRCTGEIRYTVNATWSDGRNAVSPPRAARSGSRTLEQLRQDGFESVGLGGY